jgi:hypothetical protein
MSAARGDFVEEFREYLARFDQVAGGETDFGAFAKHNGRLVKKLRYEEFEPVYREYHDIARTYFESVDRGDTINDIVVKLIRERASELVLTSPV